MVHEQPGYQDRPLTPEVGMLKQKEREDLENRIADTLRNLNSRLTKKEIVALMNRIEVGKGLEGLKQELVKEKKLEGSDLSDEVLRDILNLFREAQEVAGSSLEELKLELSGLNISREYDIESGIYPSSRIAWVKRLEESELGDNIVIDLAGIGVGVLDSAQAILKFLLSLLKDVVMLPRDVVAHMKQK